MATGRTSAISAGGNSTAGLLAGGDDGSSAVGATEELNFGSTTITPAAWSSGDNLSTGRNLSGRAGTQTAGLAISGYTYITTPTQVTDSTEEYNGSAWSAGGPVNTARYGMQGDGSQTSAIIAGGISPPAPEFKNITEEYNGSTWTTSPATINTTRGYVGHAGGPAAQTASIIFGGRTPGPNTSNASESYNGSAWTTTPNMNTSAWGRYGGGTLTAALSTGATPPELGTTEEWDGSSWTTVNSQITGRTFRGQAGTQTECIVFGSGSPAITTTEVSVLLGTLTIFIQTPSEDQPIQSPTLMSIPLYSNGFLVK